jgi:hypothetical protein
MSEDKTAEADTIAAGVSAEYLADMRLRVRSTADRLDGEIRDLISAARSALALGGVLPERAENEDDPLIKQAVATYIKAEFGLDNDDADKYRASFERQKVALALASDYIESREE